MPYIIEYVPGNINLAIKVYGLGEIPEGCQIEIVGDFRYINIKGKTFTECKNCMGFVGRPPNLYTHYEMTKDNRIIHNGTDVHCARCGSLMKTKKN